MLMQVFTVFDRKAKIYMPPFCFRTRSEAVRAFSESCRDSGHMFCKHPEDFALYSIGDYDDQTGEMLALKNGPEIVIYAQGAYTPAARVANGEDPGHNPTTGEIAEPQEKDLPLL